MADVSNLQLQQIAGSQLVVDAKIEERQFPCSAENSKLDADSSDFLEFEWRLLTDKFAFVPRSMNDPNSEFIHGRLLKVGGAAT